MRAVADAGPLIHLSWIDHLHLLPLLFDRVMLPPTVRDEVLSPPSGTLGLERIQQAIVDGTLQLIEVSRPSDDLSVEALDAGEQAALDLALEIDADIVLSDDAHAREAASRRGFLVMGTVGILGKAREMGLVPATYPLLLELRRNGQWLSDDLLETVRSQETQP